MEHTSTQEMTQKIGKPATRSLGTVAAVAGAVTGGLVALVGGGIAYSQVAIDHDLPLPRAIEAERETLWLPNVGELSYYQDRRGTGRPIVLIHSINAAGSAYEVRPLFEALRGSRPVYALELPGFGFSERSDRDYTPRLYTDAVIGFLRSLDLPEGGVDVVALSLSSEFAARAALEHPNLIASLALVSPTGLSGKRSRNSSERRSEGSGSRRLYNILACPLWAQAFYDMLASQWSIRYYLKKSFVGEPNPGLAGYSYETTHQPGARFAPLHFVSGQLFSPDIRTEVYEHLTQPVLVIYDKDGYVTFDALPQVMEQCENWHAVRIVPTRGLPQFEKPGETIVALRSFWQTGKPASGMLS